VKVNLGIIKLTIGGILGNKLIGMPKEVYFDFENEELFLYLLVRIKFEYENKKLFLYFLIYVKFNYKNEKLYLLLLF
jgi:hypothetical protein